MALTTQNSHYSDRLSSLPDKIIHHIFMFLGANDTVRLSTVSRRFRKLCFHSPCLFFSANFDPDTSSKRYTQFCNYVDPLLRKRKSLGVKLDRFVIYWMSKQRSINVGSGVVNSWIKLAAECGVNELDVLVFVDQWRYYELPLCLQSCESLRVLRLNLQMGRLFLPSSMRLDSLEEFVMDSVWSPERLVLASILTWRSLKRLKIQNVHRIDDISITNSSFVEELIISDCKDGRIVTPWRLSITSSSFKNLNISRSHFGADVEINLNCSSLKNVSVHGTNFDKHFVSRIICSGLENLEAYGCCFDQVCLFEIDSPSVKHVKIQNSDFRKICELNTNCQTLEGLIVADCEFVLSDSKFINQATGRPCVVIKAEELCTLTINSSDKYSYMFPLAFSACKLQNIKWTGDPVEFMHLGLESFRSLVNASIDIKPSCRHKSAENAQRCRLFQSRKYCVANLFECLSRAKTLEINMWPIEIVYMQKDEPIFIKHKLITFANLQHLVLVADKFLPEQISAVAYFLQRLPNLKTITVKCDGEFNVLSDPNLIKLLGLNVEKFAVSVGQVTIDRIDSEDDRELKDTFTHG